MSQPSVRSHSVFRRLAWMPVLALGVVTLVFGILQILPGAAFQELAGPAVDPEAAETLRSLFGSDRPVWERYVSWISQICTGDLGISQSYRRPVANLIGEAIRNTALLTGAALVLEYLIGSAAGLGLGLFVRRRSGRRASAIAHLIYAMPSFLVGTLLIGLLAVSLGWLPASQMYEPGAHRGSAPEQALDLLVHLVLPVLSLALPAAAGLCLFIADQLRSATALRFVSGARARGIGRRTAILRHGIQVAGIPVIQRMGMALPAIVGGSVVIEVLFAWPGMGRLAYQAVVARDEPLIVGCTLVGALAVLGANLAVDLFSAWLDPRFHGGLEP